MNKTGTIIKREYLSRVRKKSFIVMTILGPLLLAGLMIAPIVLSKWSDKEYKIAIVDDTRLFYDRFPESGKIYFTDLTTDIDSALELMHNGTFDAVLHIPEIAFQAPSSLRLFSAKSVNLNAKMLAENTLKHEFESLKLGAAGIDKEMLESIETKVNIQAIRIQDDGATQSDYPQISMMLGLISGLLIYIFVFLFGSQVMRGVLEEKTSRIVEIIISSVKPFQLMMGKIIGVGLVGLTQFLMWIILTFAIVGGVQLAAPGLFKYTPDSQVYLNQGQVLGGSGMTEQIEQVQQYNTAAGEIMEGIAAINFPVMIFSFIFFFLGGFLLYAALFAAIGSAVDNEADTQQFMLPVTVPLILAMVMAQSIINSPSGPVAVWLSYIPFTSPVVMMVRIPFGVPYTEVLLSGVLLILGFIATTWVASKIYRIGILMYGNKVSYGEIWKWLKQ
jgi:ABC-2 type transport system permease protein